MMMNPDELTAPSQSFTFTDVAEPVVTVTTLAELCEI